MFSFSYFQFHSPHGSFGDLVWGPLFIVTPCQFVDHWLLTPVIPWYQFPFSQYFAIACNGSEKEEGESKIEWEKTTTCPSTFNFVAASFSRRQQHLQYNIYSSSSSSNSQQQTMLYINGWRPQAKPRKDDGIFDRETLDIGGRNLVNIGRYL